MALDLDGGNDATETTVETYQRRLIGGSVRAMSAICVQIALENVNCCHYALEYYISEEQEGAFFTIQS